MHERRFYARGRYRIQGLIAWGVAALLILAVPALWGRWNSDGRILNVLGALICAISAATLLWLGWQFAQPQLLVLTEQGGRLLRLGQVVRCWEWHEVERIAWIEPSRGRFATPEPFLVLKGYDSAGSDAPHYLVPLAPFSEIAYAAVRERLLMHGW
ncbi:MAG: hypothetical protein KatS3mg057_2564 [Herpetosiphonaceae bacterium]|nr:MAG: hypothetical protein KatS3mg057_2564 [Herpetosiphonaceae bacterium]